jgi:hypothetical protein
VIFGGFHGLMKPMLPLISIEVNQGSRAELCSSVNRALPHKDRAVLSSRKSSIEDLDPLW